MSAIQWTLSPQTVDFVSANSCMYESDMYTYEDFLVFPMHGKRSVRQHHTCVEKGRRTVHCLRMHSPRFVDTGSQSKYPPSTYGPEEDVTYFGLEVGGTTACVASSVKNITKIDRSDR